MLSRVLKGFLLLLFLFTPLMARNSDFLYKSLKNKSAVYYTGKADAGIADINVNSAIFLNPAATSKLGLGLSLEGQDLSHNQMQQRRSLLVKVSPFSLAYQKISAKQQKESQIFALSFSNVLPSPVNWGFRYKGIQSQGEHFWSSDFGMLFYLFDNLNLAFTFDDLISNTSLPITFTVGSSYQFIEAMYLNLDVTSEKRTSEKTKWQGKLGTTLALTDSIDLHMGVKEKAWAAGFSLKSFVSHLDYAYQFHQEHAESHSLSWSFEITSPLFQSPQQVLFPSPYYAEWNLNKAPKTGQNKKSLFGGSEAGLNSLLESIDYIRQDKACKGLVISMGSMGFSMADIAAVNELRIALKAFKDQGKKILVYLYGYNSFVDYYLASIADKIVMPELGQLSHLGLRLDILKTKGFLDKIGLKPYYFSQGKYKTDLFPNAERLNDHEKAQLEDLLQQIFIQVGDEIHQDRQLSWDHIYKYFDGRIISATEAKAIGLIDHFANYRELKQDPDHFLNETISQNRFLRYREHELLFPLKSFAKKQRIKSLYSFTKKIAILEIDGPITLGRNTQNMLFGQRSTGADDIDEIIDNLIADPKIVGLMLRINSPGGSILASEQIYQATLRFKAAGKKLYASFGSLAASGGYYIAMASDKIYASPLSLVGSIGVLSSYTSVKGLFDMLDIESESIKTGPYMDLFSATQELDADKKQMIDHALHKSYQEFVLKVLKNRKLSQEEVKVVAQGQIFTGKQARALKLVDENKDFLTAIEEMTDDLEIENDSILHVQKKAQSIFQPKDILRLLF